MRRFIAVVAMSIMLATTVVAPSATAAPRAGQNCTPIGRTLISAGLKFTCVKVAKKKVWSKGAQCRVIGSKFSLAGYRYTCRKSGSKKLWLNKTKIEIPVPTLPCRSASGVGNPTIRLVSPKVDVTNSWDGSADAAAWVGNGWYRPGLRFFEHQVPVGSTLTLTYQAVDAAGDALCNKPITLIVNKGWSGSTATMRTGSGQDILPPACAKSCDTSGAELTATTDSQGRATWVLTNMNVESQAGDFPTELTSYHSGAHLFSQIAPRMIGPTNETIDIIEFQFHKLTAPVITTLWSEEFTGAVGQFDLTRQWVPSHGDGCSAPDFNCGWGNRELQFYTNDSVTLNGNGQLLVTAHKSNTNLSCYYDLCTRWKSGKITTKGKVRFKYGKLEARIKVPAGIGSWPAFWMLGSNIDSTPWPRSGEIDIMEAAGTSPNALWTTIHGALSDGAHTQLGNVTVLDSPLSSQYHTYGILWRADQVAWTVDGTVVYTADKANFGDGTWPFNQYFYAIFNLAVGGSFGGTPDPSLDNVSMSVDWIRFSQIDGVGSVIVE